MPLPQNFTEWEHLQDTIRLYHNKQVAQYYKNQAVDSIATKKEALRHACTIKDSDTATMTLIRLWLFEVTAGHAQSLQTPIYGIPVNEHQRGVTFKPQVKLYFREKIAYDETVRLSPATGEITFRLMDEEASTFSRAKAEILATAIKREFATSSLFVWNKGKFYYYYRDIEKGYDLRLLVPTKAEGERITKAVLSIRGHAFSDDYVDYTENTRSYPMNPGTHVVYGKTVKKPVKRPTVDVKFRYAQVLLHGREKVINLVAVTDCGLREVIERIFLA
ncbi:hypothetical protein A0J48_016140 [Sphaerospermopsis aphanizomenoides BCCUSP55]|uniref:hypothetical protein n=1 Tax=Sphaerospermopsis aphanizomenoides TaxID=459663 RepID=UPI001904AD0D|nr:hypothetical protein [Sphaerospermopsis aphanizomenoides]MBK1989051.1 hypothetical protein [Sphaerospermopsis aphanizomenoides BCCUSP55]